MIGSLNLQSREVVIVGAGISGLLMAYVLDRHGFKVTLLEESARAGGLIRSTQTQHGLVESAAQSFLVTDEVREICKDLGVVLTDVRPGSRARYILRGGKMRRFPLSPWEALQTFARAYYILSRAETSRERATIEQWGRRHLGQAAVEYLLSPLLTGIYAARPSEIAVGAAFPAWEVPAGHSLVSAQLRKQRLQVFGRGREQGRARMMTPMGGMGALVEALENRLEERLGARFRTGEKITDLPDAPNVVLAVPSAGAAGLLQSADPALSKTLLKINYAPLVSATIFVPREEFQKQPLGVGVLIPERENRRALGVLFNSSTFERRVSDEARWVSLTMMLGGTVRPELASEQESLLQSVIRDELKELFGLSDAGIGHSQISIHRWSRAIPTYDGKIMDAWQAARSGWCATPGRVLFGNYTGQVSIRGMMQQVYALGSDLAAGLHV